jgi:serine acetyltransferase
MFKTLRNEIQVVFERDPAARSVLEVIFCYPGFHAVIHHRIAHFFYRHSCLGGALLAFLPLLAISFSSGLSSSYIMRIARA